MANFVKSILDNDYGNLDGIIIRDEKICFEVDSDRRFEYEWILEHSFFVYNPIYTGSDDRNLIHAIKVSAVSGNYRICIITNIFTTLSQISVILNDDEILNTKVTLNDVVGSGGDNILNKFNEILEGVQRICDIYLFLTSGYER